MTTTQTPVKTTPKQFKVAAISKNTGAFGHKRHVLIAKDGHALDGDRLPNYNNPTIPDLKEGDTLTFQMNARNEPTNWVETHFEYLTDSRHGTAPANVVKVVWG